MCQNKNPVGVGETYGVRREKLSYYYGSEDARVSRILQNFLYAGRQFVPTYVRLLVHGDEIAQKQQAGDAIDRKQLFRQGMILRGSGVKETGGLRRYLAIEDELSRVRVGSGLYLAHPQAARSPKRAGSIALD